MNPEKLKKLILAHKEGKNELFDKVVDSIILEEEASNRFDVAKDLRNVMLTRNSIKPKEFNLLRSEVESIKNLIFVSDPFVDETNLFLTDKSKQFLDRIYLEHSNKKKLIQAGLKPKNKLLFYGPPGTGKTLTAHYIATFLGLPLCVVQLSKVVSSLMGDTATNLTKIFNFISHTPCVLLIDEFDTFAKNRGDFNDVGEIQRIVNTLLQSLDTLSSSDSIVIAATNYDETLLDHAVWRRFDGVVRFELPNNDSILNFLKYTLNGVNFSGDLKLAAKLFKGRSYAEIKTVLNESLKTMIISGKKEIGLSSLKTEMSNLNLRDTSKNKVLTQRRNSKPKK